MNKVLILIYIIISNVYAQQYKLEYEKDFSTCDGIERIVNHNDKKYVTDVNLGRDGNSYKRIVFAYHSKLKIYGKVENTNSLSYFVLLLKLKQVEDEHTQTREIDWSNSILFPTSLNGSLDYSENNPNGTALQCLKKQLSDKSLSIRDELTIPSFSPTYRLDSFIAVVKELPPQASQESDENILAINQAPREIQEIWKKINENRRYLLTKDYVVRPVPAVKNEQFLQNIFYDENIAYNEKQIMDGVSLEDLKDDKNKYIVKISDLTKEIYLCGLDFNKQTYQSFSMFLYDPGFLCFHVILRKGVEKLESLEHLKFWLVSLGHNFYYSTLYIGKDIESYSVREIGYDSIELTNTNESKEPIILHQKVMFLLQLGFLNELTNDSSINVHIKPSELEHELKLKKRQF